VGQEAGVPWSIHYAIDVGDDWQVKRATVRDDAGNELEIVVDGKGLWTINGQRRSDLEGCLDLDLEASVVTNTVPIHRLALSVGQHGQSGAVYLRTIGLEVERLDQTYRRLPDADGELRFEYQSPRFGYHDTLRFGTDGLVVEYPGIGVRR
ncbi:MAG TPA: putative glycolipid-binding domain-containing protein, partial [Jiangellales bacterium]|nr:putative glycolipid-binding domain-containing protein [Jiangellales bacterium]